MKRSTYFFALVSLTVGLLKADVTPRIIPLWPDKAPGETAPFPPELDVTGPSDRRPADRPVVRLSNVTTPTLAIYAPAADRATGAAVLVCPGGGYVRLAMDLEGSEVCAWLNSIGVTGIVLKYRVPRREGVPQYQPPVQDAQRAMGLLRQRAADFGIDPMRLGILGFSAGAHVAGVLSHFQDQRLYPAVDAADQISCRPDFALLIYPGYFTGQGQEIATDVGVAEGKTPPTFIAMAEDDPVHVENALYYYLALKRAKVPAEMHLHPVGGHGFGLRRTEALVTTWPDRAADWLRASGWIGKSVPAAK